MKSRHRGAGALGALAAVVAGLAAGAGLLGAAVAAGPKAGGQLTLVRPIDSTALDPQFDTSPPAAWVYGNILETLLVMDGRMRIGFGLARDYEVLSPTRVRLALRPHVRFHDGTPFNAEAVRFTFERADRTRPPGRWTTVVTTPLGVEVLDDLTVDVVTPEPYGALAHLLTTAFTGIVSPSAVRRLGDGFARAPVGTGPFRFVEWLANDRIVIDRNPDYWGPRAHLDRVAFRVLPEEGARMLALQRGAADLVIQPSPAQLPGLRRDGRFVVHETDGLRVVYVAMNTTAPPLDDPTVRQALNHAVDRRVLLDHVLEGAGAPVRSVISPLVFGFKDMDLDRRYPFDRAQARMLLVRAGWRPGPDGIMGKDGRRLALDWLAGRGRVIKEAELSEAVAAMLREAGVDIALEFREAAAVAREIRADSVSRHLFTWSFGTLTGDADYALYGMFHTRQPGTAVNVTRYSSGRVDRLLEAARRSVDQGVRVRLYGEVQDILAGELPWIPLYTTREIVATRADVRGFALHPLDYNFPLGSVWLDR